MPVVEGATTYPADSAGRFGFGLYDGTDFWLPRMDAQKNLRVALWDANGNPLLTVAVAAGDAEANPTVGGAKVYLMAFDGTNWRRVHADSAGNVNINQGTMIAGENLTETGTNASGMMHTAIGIRTANGPPDTWSPVGTSPTSQALPVTMAANSNGGATLFPSPGANTDIGATPVGIRSATGTNLYFAAAANGTAATAFVQFFTRTAIGSVTVGTTPPDLVLVVPPNDCRFYPIPEPGAIITQGVSVASTQAITGSSGSAAGVRAYVVTA